MSVKLFQVLYTLGEPGFRGEWWLLFELAVLALLALGYSMFRGRKSRLANGMTRVEAIGSLTQIFLVVSVGVLVWGLVRFAGVVQMIWASY